MRFRNDLILQECEFYAQNKIYIVRPISFYYIRKKEFNRDGIFTYGENASELLFSNLITKQGQVKVNKWLERLVTTDNGKKFNLKIMAKDNWDNEDLISLFETILEISGLTENKEENGDSENEDKEKGYISLYSNLLMNRTMTRQEILDSSIPYLIEVSKEINETRALTSGLGGFGGVSRNANSSTEKPIETTDMEEFANSINQFYGK